MSTAFSVSPLASSAKFGGGERQPRVRCRDKHGRFERFGRRFFLTDNVNAYPSRGFMNPSLAAVSAFGLRAPETFETAISAGARHMAQNGHLAGYPGSAPLDPRSGLTSISS